MKFSLLRQNECSISQNADELGVGGGRIWPRQDRVDWEQNSNESGCSAPTVWQEKLFVRVGYTRPGKEGIIQRHTWPKETVSEKTD